MNKTIFLIGLITLTVLVLAFHFFICFNCVAENQTVELYYYNEEKDTDEEGNLMCSEQGLEPVERIIPNSETLIEDTLQLLIQGGLTEEEQDRGIGTEYPLAGLELVGTDLKRGVLTLTFDDPLNKTSGGSCRVSVLWMQIERTASQFSEVKEVRFEPEWYFQP
ncbi:GerMN domain-containing protein [Candidatus Peregrinibacteria bacterium]|nr:MAG: GerMN domain-containing protein [Candidatus Peregrinibacteria bacterium]